MKTYNLFIDQNSCWGCKSCEVACKQENQASDGLKYISVSEDGPEMVEGRTNYTYQVNRCRHCDQPPCAEICSVEAIRRREDGLVVLDADACIGCSLCLEACPYQAISYEAEQGKARKCNLCHHRVDKGLLPACADNICLGHCIVFARSDQGERILSEKILLKERLTADGLGR
jgi:Fe-S-cluster-containing dehydrogenase component